VYGYTAYSASKFALRGLAESLQQEVIADNIHVSLIFPPDTATPGLVEGIYFITTYFLLICYGGCLVQLQDQFLLETE
jgi:NAD(P)-dependent dehydrogenase (short-subunit alcohol dehydrogenase family)